MTRNAATSEKALAEFLSTHADVDACTPCGRPLLNVAAGNDMLAAVKTLLSAGATPNNQALDGRSALHCACGTGDTELISLLLAAGSDPHMCSLYGRAPMCSARLFVAPPKIPGVRRVFADYGFDETPCENKLWDLRLLKDANEVGWNARVHQELTPHVGHTHVGL